MWEEARETGGSGSAADNFDKLVYFQKLCLIMTFATAVILQTELARLIPWAKWQIEILREKSNSHPKKKKEEHFPKCQETHHWE